MDEKPLPFSIKNWSQDDQPREKLRDKGRSSLSDAELVAILLGSGNRDESAVALSKRILASADNNLNALGKQSLKQLMTFKGIGEAKAISIAAAMELGRRRRGEEALQKMQSLGIMLDVSHSSEQVVKDILAISTKPLLVSHTGFYGHCPSPRNISDELMQQIAAKGGLIAVGFWDGAVCEPNVNEIAKAVKYGIELVFEIS